MKFELFCLFCWADHSYQRKMQLFNVRKARASTSDKYGLQLDLKSKIVFHAL